MKSQKPSNPRRQATRVGLILLGSICALAAFAIGCGGGDSVDQDREAVEAAVSGFVNAANERDFEQLCELMTNQARKSETGAASSNGCVKALSSTGVDKQGEIEIHFLDVRIADDRAAAEIRVKDADSGNRDQSLQLVREDGQWKVSEFT